MNLENPYAYTSTSTEPNFSFMGKACDRWFYKRATRLADDGTCIYCGRTGLKDNFGSKRKHIKACGKEKDPRKYDLIEGRWP